MRDEDVVGSFGVRSETDGGPKPLVGGVDVFEAFRTDMREKPQWEDSSAAQNAMKALSALSDAVSASERAPEYNDAKDDDVTGHETAPLHAVEDAAPHAADVDGTEGHGATYEDHGQLDASTHRCAGDGVFDSRMLRLAVVDCLRAHFRQSEYRARAATQTRQSP